MTRPKPPAPTRTGLHQLEQRSAIETGHWHYCGEYASVEDWCQRMTERGLATYEVDYRFACGDVMVMARHERGGWGMRFRFVMRVRKSKA